MNLSRVQASSLLSLLLAIGAPCLPRGAAAFELREPTVVAVQIEGESASTSSSRATVSGAFVQVQPLADFAYGFDCGQRKYQSEWNAIAFVETTVDCRMN